MRLEELLTELRALGDPVNVAGMARFGIRSENILGIGMTELRRIAKRIGRDHALALELWNSGVHEARILASLIDDPQQVSEEQMDRWICDFDTWAVCDACCCNLFDRTPFAYRKALEWSKREEEYVKRAGFATMAALAWHDKTAADAKFLRFLPAIRREASDDRNFVKKAVNWALRQIGKRNPALNEAAIRAARQIQAAGTRSGRWIAADALRELEPKFSASAAAVRGR